MPLDFIHRCGTIYPDEKRRGKAILEKLLELRLSEEITAEEYANQKKVLIDKKIELKEKVEDRDHSSSNWLELAGNFFETAYNAREVMKTEDIEAKRELVRAVGWNLFLRDKKLQFSFKKPYDVLLKPEIRSDVQALSNYVYPEELKGWNVFYSTSMLLRGVIKSCLVCFINFSSAVTRLHFFSCAMIA